VNCDSVNTMISWTVFIRGNIRVSYKT